MNDLVAEQRWEGEDEDDADWDEPPSSPASDCAELRVEGVGYAVVVDFIQYKQGQEDEEERDDPCMGSQSTTLDTCKLGS